MSEVRDDPRLGEVSACVKGVGIWVVMSRDEHFREILVRLR